MVDLQVGDAAPDFSLHDEGGRRVRLSDLRGRPVVLFFYPEDDTPGCTAEACGFRDNLPRFDEANARVLGVSPDDEESHRRFKEKHRLPFTLLADPGHRVADAYGAWGEKQMFGNRFEGILRSTFLIGADGRIEAVFRRVKPDGHWAEVHAALAGLARGAAGARGRP